MILVYALASRGARVAPPLRTISAGGVSAIVRAARRAPAPTEKALRAHDRHLARLGETLPSLLPVRFGTRFDDVEELRFVLRMRQRALRRALAAVRGRAQMTVRFAHPGDSRPLTPGVEAAPSGTAYLRARAEAHAVPEFDPVRAGVRRWIRDERLEKHGRVATVYHLIPRGSVPAYRAALARAAAAAGLRVVVTGPFPPYAFTTSF